MTQGIHAPHPRPRPGVSLGTGRIRSHGAIHVDGLSDDLREQLQTLVAKAEAAREFIQHPNTWLEEENRLLFFLKNVLKERTGNSMPIAQATLLYFKHRIPDYDPNDSPQEAKKKLGKGKNRLEQQIRKLTGRKDGSQSRWLSLRP
ncbi:hypothetical protein OQA88_7477 [Cercophora sp. LCS_1]